MNAIFWWVCSIREAFQIRNSTSRYMKRHDKKVQNKICFVFAIMDYGEYMLDSKSQLKQFREHELRTVVEAVLGGLDARVLRALGVYMGT